MITEEALNQNDLTRRIKEQYSDLGELILCERLVGEVVDSTKDEVTVLYEIPKGEHFEQTYLSSQFINGKLPKIGDNLIAFALLYLHPQSDAKTLADFLKEDDSD